MGRFPQLHLVTDPRLPEARLLAAIDAAVKGGVDVVQVRNKGATAVELVRLARAVRSVVAGRALVIVNGPVAVAQAAEADGAHLPEGDPDLATARAVLGPDAYIGASVHSVQAAVAAELAGVSSVTFGHVFATGSHPGEPGRGLAALRAVVEAVSVPVIAIGGIDATRVGAVVAAGAAGVAVMSAILGLPIKRQSSLTTGAAARYRSDSIRDGLGNDDADDSPGKNARRQMPKAPNMPLSGEQFRQVMRQWASGVNVVTVRHDDAIRAILVTSFLSVAIDPPTVLVSIRRDGETHRLLEAGGVFAVNLLREDQAALARRLGYADDPDARSLRTIAHHTGSTGAPLLDDCLAGLDCRVIGAFPTRDHTLFLGQVEEATDHGGAPLLHWERDFRRLLLEGPARGD